ncbi:sensor histidine kinase [Peptococcaceae bacterium 1198_IL3148]
MLDSGILDKILNKAIQVIADSQEEIYKIGETARQDCQRTQRELLAIKEETTKTILKVDQLRKEEYRARQHLVLVTQNFNRYNEQQVKDAYDYAHEKQLELLAIQEKEKLLRLQRDNLERNLKILEETLQRTDTLISNMGIVMKFLTNDFHSLSVELNELKQMQGLSLSIIKAQEEERIRVAREIHDGPAQSMANIVMRAEFCLKLMEKNPSLMREEIYNLIELTRNSLSDVRKIIFDLRPMVLDDLGLIPAIKRYAEQYCKDTGIYVEISQFGNGRRLDSSLEVALFRVIQESLTNIKKHSQAKHVLIKVEFTADVINVLIRDNGCGFDVPSVLADKQREGFGLLGMRERMQLLNGKLNIRSNIGEGTEIFINLPTDDKALANKDFGRKIYDNQ